MSNLILTNTPNDNDKNPDAEPGRATESITPSTAKKRPKRKKGKTSFHFDSSLTQASAASKGATDAPDNREEDRGRKEDHHNDETVGSGGIGQTDGTTNKPETQDKSNKDNEPKAEGRFTKACVAMSRGCDMIKVGNKANRFFFSVMSGKDIFYPEDRIRIGENQPNPFPWIAVLAPENKVMVLHSVRRFTAPFEHYHPNDGNILAFVQDTFKESGLPAIHKIPINMFEGAKEWFHPNMKTIMNKDPADCDVLPVPEDKDMVKTSMIVPIPIFLVPLFMNDGNPKHLVDMFQHFYHAFFKKPPFPAG